MTERVLTAIENPLVDCIGHLTGRLIGRREPYAIDVEAVAAAAAAAGTMLEINGNPNRRDLSEHHARLAARGRARRSSSTPTPTASRRWPTCGYAVATARRAWLTADDVANTRGWGEFKKLLSRFSGALRFPVRPRTCARRRPQRARRRLLPSTSANSSGRGSTPGCA